MEDVDGQTDHNATAGRDGALWQRDYWDRWIRDQRHFLETMAYIDANPVRAGLAEIAAEWRFGSAWWAAKRADLEVGGPGKRADLEVGGPGG